VNALNAPPSSAEPGAATLCIILPFFKKLTEFRKVLPHNAPYFASPGVEVIVVMDEPSEENALVALLAQYPLVRWRVIVNDVQHPWRPPCKAINAGLRHAASDAYALVCSPESAFIGDVPAQLLAIMQKSPQAIALGRVGFATFDEAGKAQTLEHCYYQKTTTALLHRSFYGSVCGPKAAFAAVGGYDEGFMDWGGDDDNLRVRLEMAGYALLWCPSVRLLHLSLEARQGSEQYNAQSDRIKCSPDSAVANRGVDWGRDFSRQIHIPREGAGQEQGVAQSIRAAAHTGPIMPSYSRRQCRQCARLIYHQPATAGCTQCNAQKAFSAQPVALRSAGRSTRPKIACVLQLHNEAFHLEGCLSHLKEYVDGVIALDDASVDNTVDILKRQSVVIDCIQKPVQHPHVWNELENKQLLLKRARQLGFDWVLCCDADERYEIAFLKKLHHIASAFPEDESGCVSVAFREIWGNPSSYRVDGIWGAKTRAKFFSLPDAIEFNLDQALHGQWYPDHIRRYARMLTSSHHLYHFKSMLEEDRIQRRDLYKRLDPDNKFQAMGYDYLAEAGDALRTQEIAPGHEYDLSSLPHSLRSLCA
jgi:Glycosyl transferase family 2/N-terminal domain of galactosyltransferase